MVLLKNAGGLLPLQPGAKRLAVVGPLADQRRAVIGCWAGLVANDADVETVLEGIQAYMSDGGQVTHASGCGLDYDESLDLDAAAAAARAADVVIAVLGEGEALSGEAHSRAHIGLPGRQQELLDALHATG